MLRFPWFSSLPVVWRDLVFFNEKWSWSYILCQPSFTTDVIRSWQQHLSLVLSLISSLLVVLEVSIVIACSHLLRPVCPVSICYTFCNGHPFSTVVLPALDFGVEWSLGRSLCWLAAFLFSHIHFLFLRLLDSSGLILIWSSCKSLSFDVVQNQLFADSTFSVEQQSFGSFVRIVVSQPRDSSQFSVFDFWKGKYLVDSCQVLLHSCNVSRCLALRNSPNADVERCCSCRGYADDSTEYNIS